MMENRIFSPLANVGNFSFRAWRRVRLEFWKALGRLNPTVSKTFTLSNGALFEYPLDSALGSLLSVDNFESVELDFVVRSLSPGDVLLDVGANGGLYSVLASKQVGPSGHIYAFEPGIRELVLFRRNVKINSCENVTVVSKAVSNQSGTTQFAISQDGAMNSLKQTDHPMQKFKEWQTVEMTMLDTFVEDAGIDKVDFIKIDVEGAENLVFEGATKLLSSNNKMTILFEACDANSESFGYSARDLLMYIKGMGFYIYYLDSEGKLIEVLDSNPDVGGKIYNFVACNRRES
jgi:FkbM family methyltransferase